ncbi:toll/interleukin-1 receptor domain-containing protein [Synechococcus sp. PCC 7336]|uniref:toll/interleukin-1 receptor domain-containing protein n=1 Tax=Synechococcus sp. PCC 7336 TaxID=195250 RepID=UPI0004765A66|nr:toll/interleukin-1 receptor domain-containing protein [Synechococcus sp. PCC 7336]
MPPIEVFLSHSNQDRAMAERLATALTYHGVPLFFSPENIVGAQQWQSGILSALQRCDWFVVLLSPDAIDSMWVRREVAFALQDPRYEDRIVPLKYRNCDLKSLQWLTLFQTIDFTGGFTAGCRSLLRVWGIGLREERLQ